MNAKTVSIRVVLHKLKNYDGHLVMQSELRVQGKIKHIPNNMEKYISLSLWNLRFIDSVNFLLSSLDSLVRDSDLLSFKITQKRYIDTEKLLFRKGIYPYKYMDSHERFCEEKLPAKEEFYSKLSGKGITEEYEHVKKVWEAFGCKNLGNYHDLYLTTDVLLLVNVLENFRNVCMDKYGLDQVPYYSLLSLSWDALLKKKLELLTD